VDQVTDLRVLPRQVDRLPGLSVGIVHLGEKEEPDSPCCQLVELGDVGIQLLSVD
jgi:hypothetical protein